MGKELSFDIARTALLAIDCRTAIVSIHAYAKPPEAFRERAATVLLAARKLRGSESALSLATAGRGHAGGCCHSGGADNGRHDLRPPPLPGAPGYLPGDLRSRCSCMPPHSRDGLPGLLHSLLGQPGRQLSALAPRLRTGRLCAAYGLLGCLLDLRHVLFS